MLGMKYLKFQKLECSTEISAVVKKETESEINNVGNMYWELHMNIIIELDVNGKIHSAMLSRANWWTGINGWKIVVTSSVRPRLSRNNDRRQQH